MKSKFDIPLSYNPIAGEALLEVLRKYEERHHDEMILDFESTLKSFTHSKYAVALNSGTAAIHLGLKALGVGPGDVVMASTFTYVASINPMIYLGASPFFIDSSADDWNMDPDLLETAIQQSIRSGKRPKAILVVHTYGMPAKMKEIMAIANHYEIPVLEDAAEAIGSTSEGQHVGTFGAVGILSFNNNKLITTYGGGALLTRSAEVAEKVNMWANQSRDNQPYYAHSQIGYSYRISPLCAAMGLAQMASVGEKIAHRRNVYEKYRQYLEGKVKWQEEGSTAHSNRWLTAVTLEKEKLLEVQRKLMSLRIEARSVWKPMHLQPVFGSFQVERVGVSEELFNSGMCLPSGDALNEETVNMIAAQF